MFKFFIKLIVVIALIKVFVMPYLTKNWSEIEGKLPAPAQELVIKAQDHLDENPDGILNMLFGEKVVKVDEAKKQISLLEKRMKEMQEAADKAANGG
jgi:phage portal protein BeeE